MFSQLKKTVSEKIKVFKKALFLAFVSYLYDKIANRKKGTGNGKYIENIEYEVKNGNKNNKA
ncbi:MAG: hypothetical protein WA063_04135 [Minisyncoccia bacterium]